MQAIFIIFFKTKVSFFLQNLTCLPPPVRRLVSACTYKLMQDSGPMMESMRMQASTYLKLIVKKRVFKWPFNTREFQ